LVGSLWVFTLSEWLSTPDLHLPGALIYANPECAFGLADVDDTPTQSRGINRWRKSGEQTSLVWSSLCCLYWESRLSSFLLLSTFPRSPVCSVRSSFSLLHFPFCIRASRIGNLQADSYMYIIAFLGLISFANFLCGHVENAWPLGRTPQRLFSLFSRFSVLVPLCTIVICIYLSIHLFVGAVTHSGAFSGL